MRGFVVGTVVMGPAVVVVTGCGIEVVDAAVESEAVVLTTSADVVGARVVSTFVVS